jgi:hypothetical protein
VADNDFKVFPFSVASSSEFCVMVHGEHVTDAHFSPTKLLVAALKNLYGKVWW